MAKKKGVMIPNYTYVDTSNELVKRFVDDEGNWTHYWKTDTKRFYKAVNHVLRLGYPKGDGLYEWLKNTTKDEAERRLKTAGEEGTRTHNAIRDLASGLRLTQKTRYPNDLTKRDESLTRDEWRNLEAYIAFNAMYKTEMIDEEFVVFSDKYQYAGTADRMCTILVPEGDKRFPKEFWGKRVLALVDWKTSSAIWPEYFLQLGAYWSAIFEMNLFRNFLNHYVGLGEGLFCGVIVRLGTKHVCGYEVKVIAPWEINSRMGMFNGGVLAIANDREPEFVPEIQETPWELHQPLKKAKEPVVKIKKTPNANKITKSKSKTNGRRITSDGGKLPEAPTEGASA